MLSTGSDPVGPYPEISPGKLRLLRGLAFLGLIRWYNLAMVALAQGIFFNIYFLAYLLSPSFCHRLVGFLEEEAVHTYTVLLRQLD